MGVYLAQPIKDKKIDKGETNQFKWASIGMQGWRTKMEDSHIVNTSLPNDVSIFGVFDGHGGAEVALYVQQHFVKTLLKNDFYIKKDYQKALYQTFLDMDVQLQSIQGKEALKKFQENDQTSMAGCTANVVLISKQEIYVANAGDSRSIIKTGKQTIQLSTDHKPDLPEENKRIVSAGGYVMDGRINGNLNLSRAIGDLEYKQDKQLKPEAQIITVAPQIQKRQRSPDDKFILIGCDGIWEKLQNQQISDYFQTRLDKSISLDECLSQFLDDNLAQDTAENYGCDNMSAIIVLFKN